MQELIQSKRARGADVRDPGAGDARDPGGRAGCNVALDGSEDESVALPEEYSGGRARFVLELPD